MIAKAVYDLLNNTSEVTDLLGTHQFQSGSAKAPAIFTCRMDPDEVTFPAMFIRLTGGDFFDSRGTMGAEFSVEVTVYENKWRSVLPLEALAMKVWETLHSADYETVLQENGYEDAGVVAWPPQDAEDPDGYPGLMIRTRIRAMKVG